MSAFRPLPPRPSLEYEHKEAKALVRRLRAGDPESLARARDRHPTIDTSSSTSIRLSDAQLVIAREYGFTSWPRLVRYFGDVERQQYVHHSIQSGQRDFYDSSVRSLLVEHRDRRRWAGHALSAYVPRFYGASIDEVFASAINEDEARLAVARQYGYPSWDVLLERVAAEIARRPKDWEVDPMRYASEAIEVADLAKLKRVVEASPDLLHPSDYEVAKGRSLMRSALDYERILGVEALRPIVDWLAPQGLDLQLELNRQLCGQMHMKADNVRYLLDRGADPNWIAPNGIPVLEHALIRYWNGEAVDVLAERAIPRKGLWIAAGLGDSDGVREFLDRDGKPTPAARRFRPDFDAVGPGRLPLRPDPDDEEILMEAFFVAVLNNRAAVVEYMVSRGFSPDSLVWGSPVINLAVGNAWTPMVECLVRCGASLDLRGWRPHVSARESAREMFENHERDPQRRRIAELCGLDPAVILAERDARPVNPPRVAPKLQEALELAGDDAFRLGQGDIRRENLLFGLLRTGGLPLRYFAQVSGLDSERFHVDVKDRVRPANDRVDRSKLPLHADAQSVIQSAIAFATERRREVIAGLDLLYALIRDRSGPTVELIEKYGGSVAKLSAELDNTL